MLWLSVEENIAYGLKIKHMDKQTIKESVNEMLELVGLTDYRSYYLNELSVSMLLMDEPYRQLDVELRFKLKDELIKIWEKLGTTVFYHS